MINNAIRGMGLFKVKKPRVNFKLIASFDNVCLDPSEETELFNGVVDEWTLLRIRSVPGLFEHYVITNNWTDIFTGNPPACPYIIPPGNIVIKVRNASTTHLCGSGYELYEIRVE